MAPASRMLALAACGCVLLAVLNWSALSGKFSLLSTALPAAGPSQLSAAFARADLDGDGKLSTAEFSAAAAEIARRRGISGPPTRWGVDASGSAARPSSAATTGRATAAMLARSAAHPAAAANRSASDVGVAAAGQAVGESGAIFPLPKCSILFFLHVVKTAGTTMRSVLQRQARLAPSWLLSERQPLGAAHRASMQSRIHRPATALPTEPFPRVLRRLCTWGTACRPPC